RSDSKRADGTGRRKSGLSVRQWSRARLEQESLVTICLNLHSGRQDHGSPSGVVQAEALEVCAGALPVIGIARRICPQDVDQAVAIEVANRRDLIARRDR